MMQGVQQGTRWMLRLEDGDDLFGQLGRFAEEEGVRAGAIVFGLGMFRRGTIGYWDGTQ